jgi:peptide/nickel transport system substrate-binding protein
MRSRHIRAGALCVAVATLAYGPMANAATKTTKGKTLTIGMLGGISTSYAAFDAELGNRALLYQAPYDSLLHLNPDGTVSPWLATKWSYNADLTVLTMTLRSGVKFTDGKPLNADAAAKNLMRLKGSKGIAAPFVSAMTGAKAVNATTLEITLAAPDPAFLDYLGGTSGMIESPANFDKPSEKTVPVGSGPYILDTKKTVADSVYVYKSNPSYWNKSKVKYSDLILRVISDPTAMSNALKAGEINGGNVLNNDAVADLKGSGLNLLPRELDWAGFTITDFDGKLNSPLKDVRVRKALNHAIDRAAILKGFGQGYGTVTSQVFRKGSPMFDAALDATYPYDPAKAKALLVEAGVKDGFEVSMAKVGVLGEAIWVLLADQLSAVGIKVKWVDTPINEYFTDILAPKYPMFFMFLEQNGNDWAALQFLSSKTAIWNPAKHSDSVTDDLFAKAQRATAKDRPALLKAYGKRIHDEAWYVPLYRVGAFFAVDSKTNAEPQTGNAIPLLFSFSPK